jgi:anti-sigma B factor antagonist
MPAARKYDSGLVRGGAAVQISVRRIDKTAILELTGSIDLSSSPAVRKILLHELRESRTPRVILNLEKVKYIDSSGVASLVEGLRASRDIGSRLLLFGLTPVVREVLQLSRLLKIFEIYENEQQALSA